MKDSLPVLKMTYLYLGYRFVNVVSARHPHTDFSLYIKQSMYTVHTKWKTEGPIDGKMMYVVLHFLSVEVKP